MVVIEIFLFSHICSFILGPPVNYMFNANADLCVDTDRMDNTSWPLATDRMEKMLKMYTKVDTHTSWPLVCRPKLTSQCANKQLHALTGASLKLLAFLRQYNHI